MDFYEFVVWETIALAFVIGSSAFLWWCWLTERKYRANRGRSP